MDALLERYAKQVLQTEPPPASAPADETAAWRARVREDAINRIGEIRRHDEPDRKQITGRLATRPERDRIWGQHKNLSRHSLNSFSSERSMVPAPGNPSPVPGQTFDVTELARRIRGRRHQAILPPSGRHRLQR
jgi:hypothetical protein